MRRRIPLLLALVAVLGPLVVLAVRVVVDGAPTPAGDVGLIALRAGDVGGPHTPVLGSYSRFGYNQPGPALLWWLAVPYRLAGRRFAGLEVGALLLGGLSFGAVLWVAWRRAGAVGVAGTAAVVALFAWACGPAWLTDPWEPHVLVPLGLALLVLTADTVAGRAWSLPLVVAAASFIAQAWGTMLPFAVALGGLAAVTTLVRRRWSAVAAAAAVALVLWSPVLVEQATHDPGNLAAMARTLSEPGPRLGARPAWRAVAGELGHRPTWVGFDLRLDGFSPHADVDANPLVPVGLVFLLGAAGAAIAGRRRGAGSLVAATLVGITAAWWSLARLIPPLFVWIPQWLGLLGAATALGVGAAVAPRVRHRAVVPALLAVAGGLAMASTAAAVRTWRTPDPLRDAVAELVGPAATAVGDEGPVLVRSRLDTNQALGGQDVAPEVLVLGLERHGVETVVDADAANRFGPRRAHPERATVEVRLVRADEEVPAGFERVAEADPLGASGRRSRTRLLTDAGFAATTSDRDLIVPISRDPSLRRLALALAPFPDLPRVAVLVGPPSQV